MKKLLAVFIIPLILLVSVHSQENRFDILKYSFDVPVTQSRLVIPNPLFDQLTGQTGTQAISSMYFDNPSASVTDLHNMAADDFTVPFGVIWHVETIELSGAYFNAVSPSAVVPDGSGFNVSFYSDNDGQVGPLHTAFTNQSFTQSISGSPSWAGSFVITLDSVLSLPAGTYWVSCQIIKNPCDSSGDCLQYPDPVGEFTGQWGWREAGTNIPIMNESMWQNPPGGWIAGNACQAAVCDTWGFRVSECGIGINWTDWINCTGPDDPPRDFQFALGGTSELEPPPVPALNKWALIGFVSILAVAGVFFLRKKA
ncbi:MAG: hypothetical protein CSA81_06675 [Acidobacteria bacterium]|nr:MAG: hypothetical protein CSA81_06675 [Acidobacteriota bacterium]